MQLKSISLRPLIIGAAASVIVASGVGVAAFTGLIPSSRGQTATSEEIANTQEQERAERQAERREERQAERRAERQAERQTQLEAQKPAPKAQPKHTAAVKPAGPPPKPEPVVIRFQAAQRQRLSGNDVMVITGTEVLTGQARQFGVVTVQLALLLGRAQGAQGELILRLARDAVLVRQHLGGLAHDHVTGGVGQSLFQRGDGFEMPRAQRRRRGRLLPHAFGPRQA